MQGHDWGYGLLTARSICYSRLPEMLLSTPTGPRARFRLAPRQLEATIAAASSQSLRSRLEKVGVWAAGREEGRARRNWAACRSQCLRREGHGAERGAVRPILWMSAARHPRADDRSRLIVFQQIALRRFRLRCRSQVCLDRAGVALWQSLMTEPAPEAQPSVEVLRCLRIRATARPPSGRTRLSTEPV